MRIEAETVLAVGVGHVIDRVRPDIEHGRGADPPTSCSSRSVPSRRPAAEVRRFRTAPGKTELLLIAARIAHHVAPPAAVASSASSNGRAARQ